MSIRRDETFVRRIRHLIFQVEVLERRILILENEVTEMKNFADRLVRRGQQDLEKRSKKR